MLEDIKELLLQEPEHIKNVLEQYDFYNVTVGTREIRCARSEIGNKTSIRIKLEDNPQLFVQDYAKAKSRDIISFIMNERDVEFKDVLNTIKEELGITDYYCAKQKKRKIFGGFFQRLSKHRSFVNEVLDESVLDQYIKLPNRRFSEDGITIETQKVFGIGYDVVSQRITIPIRNSFGQLVGVKGRANWEVGDDEPKYLYMYNMFAGEVLFGYCENYSDIQNGTVVICEAEKAVMQAHSMGYHNFVAIGGNTISTIQAKLIMGMLPKKIVLMLDKGLEDEIIEKNIETLETFSRMFDIEIYWWDASSNDIPDKANAVDLGKDRLDYALANELVSNDI